MPSVASSCSDLPVILATIRLLAPFNILHTCLSSSHASEPYTSFEHTPVTYRRIFKRRGVDFDAHMCLIYPAVFVATAIRAFTSVIWLLSALNLEPRYLKT